MRYLVLFLICAACRGPVALPPAPIDDGLPPIPATVTTQLGEVRVLWADSLKNEEGHELLGAFHLLKREIYLNSAILSRAVAYHVLYHEKCHMTFYTSGMRRVVPDNAIQIVCDAFAADRVAEMLAKR